MKYVVFEKIINFIVENNIEIDKEIYEILLNIKNYNDTTQELLEKILLDDGIKDKKKFLNYLVQVNGNRRTMNTLLKILNNETIRENDKYIKLILYKFDDIARDYVFENINNNKILDNEEVVEFISKQHELIQKEILICLKNGMSNEQLMRLMKTSSIKIKDVIREIEVELLDEVTSNLEEIINKIGNNPTIDNLKELQLKQKSYNEIVGIFKIRISGSVETEIELDKNKRMILVNNISNNQNK